MINRLRAWLDKLNGVVPGQEQELDFSSELESHLQLHIDDNLRSRHGSRRSPAKCHSQARRH